MAILREEIRLKLTSCVWALYATNWSKTTVNTSLHRQVSSLGVKLPSFCFTRKYQDTFKLKSDEPFSEGYTLATKLILMKLGRGLYCVLGCTWVLLLQPSLRVRGFNAQDHTDHLASFVSRVGELYQKTDTNTNSQQVLGKKGKNFSIMRYKTFLLAEALNFSSKWT